MERRKSLVHKQIAAALCALMLAGFAWFDFSQPLGVASGVPYVAVCAVALLANSRRLLIVCSFVSVVLIGLGMIVSPAGAALDVAIMNRALAAFGIVVVGMCGYLLMVRQADYDARLLEMALVDGLTGISSRSAIMLELNRRLQEAERYRTALSVLMIDIDHFKRVNDNYGHLQGDAVLKQVSAKCRETIRETDLIGRYGGEEFLVICPNTPGPDATRLAERIRRAVAAMRPSGLSANEHITVSVGVASLTTSDLGARELLGNADSALYAAKNAGRNRVAQFVDPEDPQAANGDRIQLAG